MGKLAPYAGHIVLTKKTAFKGSLGDWPSAINLPGEAERKMYWRAFDRSRLGYFNRVKVEIVRRFQDERAFIVQNVDNMHVSQSVPGSVEEAINRQGPAWQKVIERANLYVGEAFGLQTFRGMDQRGALPGEFKAESDQVMARIMAWVKNEAAKKVRSIVSTTRDALRKVIALGIDKGESIPEIAKRVDRLYLDEIIPRRSVVIARTEVIQASNLGSLEGARMTGLDLTKEWLSTRDDRTRGQNPGDLFNHISPPPEGPDGEERPLNAPFLVSGESMQFAGDPSLGASPGNTIQCRCTQIYKRSA